MELGERVAEQADHPYVGNAVPHSAPGAVVRRLGHRRPVEPEPRAEGLAVGPEKDDPHVVVPVGGVERGVELVAERERDRVELVGPA